jgi:site-specific recombinase XerD
MHSPINSTAGKNPLAVPPAALAFERFQDKYLESFYARSNSAETRRAYRRVAREFFTYLKWQHPRLITTDQIREWRDKLRASKKKASTVAFKLAVIRSMFEHLREKGYVDANPATVGKIPPPAVAEDLRGRALTVREVQYLLAGPDRARVDGARDYALMLLMVRTSLRVSEACGLKRSSIIWSHGRWLLKFQVKGGRERKMPLPKEIKVAIDEYLRLDRKRRTLIGSDKADSYIFQPLVNYRTLEFDKPLSATQVWKVVRKWADYTAIGRVSPHDLRRTAITRALDQGLSYRQVRMMTGHKSLEMVMRYDHHRENMELNAVNFLDFGEQLEPVSGGNRADEKAKERGEG